jgi:hypothetical protein
MHPPDTFPQLTRTHLWRLGPLCALLLGCSGGGGSPTAPPPSSTLAVGGSWSGYELLLNTEPRGNCWGDATNANAGAHGDYRVTIGQAGSAVTLTVVSTTDPGDRTAFAGTVGSSTLVAAETQGIGQFQYQCGDGRLLSVHDASGDMDLAGTASRLSGRLTEVFEVTDPQNPAATQDISVNYRLDLTR